MLAALGAGLFAALSDRLRPVSSVVDIDDTLRRLQIEDLLADNQWFDRTLPFVSMETPYVSPWSRLVDAPYYLITRALEPMLGTKAALDVACLIWPPLLLLPLVILLHGAVRKLLGRDLKLIEAGVFAVFLMQAAVEFAPGRIDHHNVQMVLLALFVRGLTMDRPAASGLVAGTAAMLSLAVGLETVPMLAVGMAGLAVAGAMGPIAAAPRLMAAGGALLVLAPAAGLMLVGPTQMLIVRCDELSSPWISAAMGGGLLLMLAPTGWRAIAGDGAMMRLARVASLGGAGLLLIAALAAAFPVCTGGPLHMIDPVTKAFWLDNVPQEVSGLSLVTDETRRAFAVLICLSIGAAILAGAAALAKARAGDARTLIVWAVAVTAILLTLFAVRYVRFSFLMAALLLPLAAAQVLAWRSANWPGWKRWAGAAAAGSAAFVVAGFSPLAGTDREVPVSYLHFRHETCAGEDFARLKEVPPGVVMTPFGLNYSVIGSSAGHQLSTISFHRSAPGIRRMALAFTSDDPATMREALDGIDYIVVCAAASPLPMDDMPLYRDLTHQIPRPGFERAAPDETSRLLIYRVHPDAL